MEKIKKEAKIISNNLLLIGMFALIILLNLNIISAFGVSSAYYDNYPLKLTRGESRDFYLTLQNMAGDKNITAKAEISEGSDIIKITDSNDIYSIPLGEKTKVNLRATVPIDAKIGDTYSVGVSFTTISVSESGEFGFGSSVVSKFQVVVMPTDEETAKARADAKRKELITQWAIYLTVGIIILIAIILFIAKKKKRKKKR